MRTPSDDPNEHIRVYLDYYISLASAPNYAVMIEGPWGIGKTFLTKNLLSTLINKPQKYIYVSLYGLSTSEQLDDALFGAFYQIFDSFAGKMVLGVVRGGMKAFRADPGFKRSDFLKKCSAELYVFDDLERCNMPPQQALGLINQIVEHSGGKVVILANEASLKNNADYKAVKEKVVGKTLVVQPVFDTALAHFLEQVQSSEARLFLEENSAEIRAAFEFSSTQNFRILQQSLWDFERLFDVLQPKQISNTEAMGSLLIHFLAYSIELKSGVLDDNQIRQGANKYEGFFEAGDDKPKQPHSELAEKYHLIGGNRVELRGELWAKILLDGRIDADIVSKALANAGWFSDPADQPEWKTIWYRHYHSAEEVEAALKTVRAQVTAKSFTKAGEILHIFGLMLVLSSIGALNCSKTGVLEFGKRYVDELRADRHLQLPPDFDDNDDVRYGSYGGLGFAGTEIAEFSVFRQFLHESRIRAKTDLYDEQARTLLDTLKRDPDAFCAAISETSDPRGEFCRTPILSKIDTVEFVDTLLRLHPKVQDRVQMHLYWRYDHTRLRDDLSGECAWAQALVAELGVRMEAAQPLDKERIKFALGYHFKNVPRADEVNPEDV